MAYIERGQALYTQLANTLREQITSGALPPGSPLPSEAQMKTTYGVSRPTARAAINALRAEGIVTVLHGKGSFVRHAPALAPHTHPRAVTRTPTPIPPRRRRTTGAAPAAAQWRYTDSDTEAWTVVGEPGHYRITATAALALALVVPEHTPLFTYDRVLQDQTGQRMTHRLYLPIPICAEVPALESDPFRTPGELYTLLGAHYGELRFTEHVRARMPTPDDITTLRLPEATPLLHTQRTTHTPGGRPLALEETHLCADNTQLAYTLTPDGSE